MYEIIYTAYNTLQNILQNKMPDINPNRAGSKQRFVYPTLPTSLDDEYPRITIKLDSFTPTPIGASNVICYDKDERIHGLQVSMSFKILIFVKKETIYPIEIDNQSVKAKNELLIQNLNKLCYLTLFKSIINKDINRDGFWINSVSDLTVTPGSFEFDTNRIASEIGITINGIEHVSDLYGDSETINEIYNTIVVLLDPEA